MIIKEIIEELERTAPLRYQESYDNSGLIIGNPEMDITKILICFDLTFEVITEAIDRNAGLIISHHPVIFEPIKKINGKSNIEKIIIAAIQNNIAVYAAHTSLDNAGEGINSIMAKKIGLKNTRVLLPAKNSLRKLVTFCPIKHIDKVRNAIFEAGAGHIGEYDCCSYNITGQGSFRASNKAKPFVGKKNQLHFEDEIRFETIYPVHIENNVINGLLKSHPYEEIAYDIYPLENTYPLFGAGLIGDLNKKITATQFLSDLKKLLNLKCIKHNGSDNKSIKKVALCGGSGSFLIKQAITQGADIFISAEFKHNHYVDYLNNIIIADIGHYESEHFAKDLIKSILIKKFPKFAVEISKTEKNPVFYT